MRNKSFVDCFMLMGTALSIKGPVKSIEVNRPIIQDVFTNLVTLSLEIENFKVFDLKYMDFELTGQLNQQWVDPQLGANIVTRRRAVAGQIWKPKITNINGKSHLVTDDTTFWRGFGDEGDVLLSEKFSIRFRCTMHFKTFPFDSQICQVKFGSYRFPNEEVALTWSNTAVSNKDELMIPEFLLKNISTFTEIETRLSGNFSVAVVQLMLQRNSLHYVLCIFTPCFLLIIMCYLTLLIDSKKSFQRLVINLFVLGNIIMFQYISMCLTYPVPYMKAMDTFVAICSCFSFISVLETALIVNFSYFEDDVYYLRKQTSPSIYSIYVYWIERCIKIAFPIFFIFTLILFSFII